MARRPRRGSTLAELERKHRGGPPWFDDRGGVLLAIDLGKRKVGVAAFDEDGVLFDTRTLHHKGEWTAEGMAHVIASWIESIHLGRPGTTRVVAEWPEHYEQRRDTHKNIDQLLDVGGYFSFDEKYRPATWKSSLPKRIYVNRLRASLSTSELALFDAVGHDGKDAVGIGMFALGRVNRAAISLI